MLVLELELLTGRYTAAAAHDRLVPEWPLHPARVFSALVAALPRGADETGDLDVSEADGRAALEALEALGPPTLWCSAADMRPVLPIFVPVGDVHLTQDTEAVDAALAEAQRQLAAADPKARKAAEKALKAAEAERAKLLDKDLRADGKLSEKDVGLAWSRFFAWGLRKQRSFPTSLPADPRVYLVWPGEPLSAALRADLDVVCARVHRVGHSSSLASLRVITLPDGEAPPAGLEAWAPTDGPASDSLRVVSPGQLQRLEAEHAVHRETEPRVLPATSQGYARPGPPPAPAPPRGHFEAEPARWLLLARTAGPGLPLTAGVAAASALRRCLMRFAGTPTPRILSGHLPDGRPDDQPHLAVLPLAFVGHAHADGLIKGLALVPPRGCPDEALDGLLDAVAAWEDEAAGEGSEAGLPLHLGRAGVLSLRRIEADEAPWTLRPSTWCAPSTLWVSVTPVALDRNPGNLDADRAALRRAHATGEVAEAEAGRARAARARAAAVAQVCAMLERQGLPAPVAVEIDWQPQISGSAPVGRFPPFPPEPADHHHRKVKVHLRLRFAAPVGGPLVLGAGRYRGLGLLRPVVDEEARR